MADMGRQPYGPQFTRHLLWITSYIILLILGACGGQSELPSAPFRPPTLSAAATQLLSPTHVSSKLTETPIPTPAPSCADSLTYLEDLTIPDGTAVKPGDLLDKRWRVKNSGTCNWDERYHLKLIGGPDLGAPTERALYPARGGSEAMIRILFIAPQEAGTYRSAWQAVDSQGNAFGDPIFIEVTVTQP